MNLYQCVRNRTRMAYYIPAKDEQEAWDEMSRWFSEEALAAGFTVRLWKENVQPEEVIMVKSEERMGE